MQGTTKQQEAKSRDSTLRKDQDPERKAWEKAIGKWVIVISVYGGRKRTKLGVKRESGGGVNAGKARSFSPAKRISLSLSDFSLNFQSVVAMAIGNWQWLWAFGFTIRNSATQTLKCVKGKMGIRTV
ncbi:unnamed protein product [Citrullus colocynthis]|uniref:Uncharacterized protein n=1 Tax=Citrullus colocynthis TaxID=252529 RepID=A0ABP0Z126_9ROSI